MASAKDDNQVSNLSLSLSKLGLGPPPGSKYDSFYSPDNASFYSQYAHNHLDKKRRQIRLLKVFQQKRWRKDYLNRHSHWIDDCKPEPGFLDKYKTLACEVIDGVPLSVCTGQYLALSYAAGDPKDTNYILVNGCYFQAFSQLVHALECAVLYCERNDLIKDGYCLLWADQICINQSDPEERGHQVLMMRDIYSCSKATLVCLSTRSPDEVYGYGDYGGRPGNLRNGLEWFTKMKQESASLVDVLWNNCLEEDAYSCLESIAAFLLAPWWARSWVYQEFVSSPDVHFVFQDEDGPWEEISAYLTPDLGTWADEWSTRLGKHPDRSVVRLTREEYKKIIGKEHKLAGAEELVSIFSSRHMQESIGRVTAMLDGRSHQDSQLGDLRVLLSHARNFRASDARDKVFAFVGLAQEEYGFEPDYSPKNTAVHVHTDAARRIIEHDQDLTYLLEQAFVGRGDLGYFLPSWVPDWNCQADQSVLQELEQYVMKAKDKGDSSQSLGTVDGEKKVVSHTEVDDKDYSRLWVTGKHIATLGREWKAISRNVRQFTLENGAVGYAPFTARPGDEIWSLGGCEWLALLRNEESTTYYFGGLVVVHGLRDDTSSQRPRGKIVLI